MVVVNHIPYPSSWDKLNVAGAEWFQDFRERNDTLSICTPEGCSLSRFTSFNESNAKMFFDNLDEVYKMFPEFANGTTVFNLDETCTSTVQKPPKVVVENGLKQVSKCASGEKGMSVTTCCIISATGNTVAPVMIFPRVHFKALTHHTNSSKKSQTLLLYDNHGSHLSIKVLELEKNNCVTVCRVHAAFRLRLIFTYAAFWTCASSFSLTPTLSYLLPCLGLLFGTQDHFCAGLRPSIFLGNSVWFSFQIRFRSRAEWPVTVVRRRDVHEVP
jgi:hypothetical protein